MHAYMLCVSFVSLPPSLPSSLPPSLPQLSGENGAYELAIEDMDHRNKDLEEELTRLKVRVWKYIYQHACVFT